MFQCRFCLNDKPLSNFEILDEKDALLFPAFSGQGSHVNKRLDACLKDGGPIPPGRYYIVDRQSGGRLEWLYNLFSDHSIWFALYADDGEVDDKTLCEKIVRGSFRLHPRGPRGISEGCITIQDLSDFHRLRLKLKSKPPTPIQGRALSAYGIVAVV